MPNQVLYIEPQNELKFKVNFSGQFEQGHTTYMRLTNPTSDTVLFKIKTTAPKKYCVRPNSGALEPNEKVEIAITPQPVHVDPAEKHKHKFMVQSLIAPEGKTNVEQVWKESNPENLMDYKLKCVFETPCGTNLNDAGDNAGQSEVTKKRVAVADDKQPAAIKVFSTKPEHGDNDFHKINSEIVQLREEESKLRHENLQLKEEIMRLRQSRDGRTISPHVYGPDKVANPLMPWLAIAIGMAFLGILIGKFFM